VREEANKLLFVPYAEFFKITDEMPERHHRDAGATMAGACYFWNTIDVHTRRHAVKPYREC